MNNNTRIQRTSWLYISFILVLGGYPSLGIAWEGHDWPSWVEITHATKPVIVSPQAGLSELLPLLCSDSKDSLRIDSIQVWENKRDRILNVLQKLLGQPNPMQPLPPLAELLDEKDQGSHIRKHIRIRSEADDWIPAYLLIPKNRTAMSLPTMIVLHQTVAQGKDEPCGIQGSPELAFGIELVERGFFCILPDAIGFGERIPPQTAPYHNAREFYRKHPQWSFFGKMVWDIQRIVDYLNTLSEVDPYRIGCIGHSHGAYGTIMGAIFEPRISAAVASCGFTTLRKDPNPDRWSQLTPLMPALGFYLPDVDQAPLDWHEIIACLAPRPYFNWSTLEDKIFPNTQNLRDIFQELRGVYSFYGAADSLAANLVPGDHSFPTAARKMAYQWLEHHLAPRSLQNQINNETPEFQKNWESRRSQIKSLLIHDIGPVDPPQLDVSVELLSLQKKDGYVEKKIRYDVAPNEPVSAYLLVPDVKKDRCPAMIVFHQTTELGKEEAVGHSGRAGMHFGPELARRGYIVLAPDSICAGERITSSGAYDTRDFYQRYPTYSAMGKMIQDGRRALDVLQTFPGVNPERIGVIGHSLGAEEALFTAAFDERVKASIASCGYAPLQAEKSPDRWARDHWFSYMPRLRIDLRAGRLPAWDFDQVIQLIAPRGYFNYQTTEDEIFPAGKAAHPLVESLQPLWKNFGAEDRLRSLLELGPHDISIDAKNEIYPWLDLILKKL